MKDGGSSYPVTTMRNMTMVIPLVLLAGCNPFGTSWADDCEKAYKERLRSPATYKRIEANVFAVDVPLEEYIASSGTNLGVAQKENLRLRKPPVKKWIALIKYDAANALGVPIRGSFACEETNTTGKEPEGGRSDGLLLVMKVNGESNHDLQMKAVRQQFSK